MKISIVTVGTRGDVQPYVALGLGLSRAGHTVKVVTDPATGMQEVTLAVPRTVAPAPVDEIVVTARRPDRVPLPQLKPHRFVADYDNDYYSSVAPPMEIPYRTILRCGHLDLAYSTLAATSSDSFTPMVVPEPTNRRNRRSRPAA